MIEEFSSIFLILYHLFPHVTLFKKIFHQFFVLFRIVIPTGDSLSHVLSFHDIK